MPTSERTAYCPTCDAERRVLLTIEWQEDTCVGCGRPLELESASGRGE